MASTDTDMTAFAEEAVNTGIDVATESLATEMRPSAEEVKAAAADLVSYTELLVAQAQANEALASGVQNSDNPTTVLAFSKRLVDTKEKFKTLMDKVFTFQNLSNAYLGQTVVMTFVSIGKNGQVELYKVKNDIEHLAIDRASKSHGGAFSGRYKYTKSNLKDMYQIANSKYDQSSLDTTFSEVYRRYNISKARLKLGGAAYILWNDNGWDGAWISGAGPLGEGYLNFFINEYLFSGMVESDVRDFMLNTEYGAVNADNASGFLQGDVSRNGIEFGVKMKGASSFSYMEVIEYAKQIQDAANVETFLRNLKEELNAKKASNLVKPLNRELTSEMESLIDSIVNMEKK